MLNDTNVLILALIGGILPALFWLWFWIREDRLKPEPKSLLLVCFLGGILAVFLALFIELMIYYLFVNAEMPVADRRPLIFWLPLKNLVEQFNLVNWQQTFWQPIENNLNQITWFIDHKISAEKIFLTIISAPIIEETLKLIFAHRLALNKKTNDEPIDASIYLLTTALGFAAVETALFLTSPISKGQIIDTLIADNFRSIGPMLIHLVCSAILGIFIGRAFYKRKIIKFFSVVGGLIVAILLHASFNLLITLNETTKQVSYFWLATLETWFLVVILLVLFNQIKRIKKTTLKARNKIENLV